MTFWYAAWYFLCYDIQISTGGRPILSPQATYLWQWIMTHFIARRCYYFCITHTLASDAVTKICNAAGGCARANIVLHYIYTHGGDWETKERAAFNIITRVLQCSSGSNIRPGEWRKPGDIIKHGLSSALQVAWRDLHVAILSYLKLCVQLATWRPINFFSPSSHPLWRAPETSFHARWMEFRNPLIAHLRLLNLAELLGARAQTPSKCTRGLPVFEL